MSFPDPITPAPRATSEASLNLPAARALAEEAKQWHDSAYPEKAPVEKLIATLFALCDEVERYKVLVPLARLGRSALDACRDGGDYEGGDIQDAAEDCGAVVRTAVGPESYCSEDCVCAEMESDFCYRDSPATLAARTLLDQEVPHA